MDQTWWQNGTPTKRAFTKRPFTKHPMTQCPFYKTSSLQNFNLHFVPLQNFKVTKPPFLKHPFTKRPHQ
jgi:hypothetical protein